MVFHDLSPPGEPKLEMSAVNHKRSPQIHLLNLHNAKNDDSQPTFSALFSRLVEALQMWQKTHDFDQK